ncbi:MAG: hypothetical protein K0R65_1818 [Crocinitomicaceae bacterium]|jgi:hypothetical protein|nr:hypothetical protein [Crocinitomicaceae bacterium]
MKLFKSIAFILTATVLLIMSSCSEEIKPSTDGRETAVVYCILNAKDSIHYVKINKAFYGGGNMTQTALIADSSYFEKVDITITEYIGSTAGRSWELMDTIIANKEPGAFYAPEQKLYYFKTDAFSPLSSTENTKYKLKAVINDGEFTVNGETSLVGGLAISSPGENIPFTFATDNIAEYGYATGLVNIATGNAKKIEVFLDIEFEEYVNSSLLNTQKFTWKVAEFEDDIKSSMSAGANGQTFYELIAENASTNPQITRRLLKGINIRVNGASNELQKYMLLSEPSSSLAQNKPSYTNLTVTNDMRVIGIFASRDGVARYKPKYTDPSGVGISYVGCINNPSMKELCNGQITGHLLFCSDNPVDVNKNYFCN